MIAYEAVTIVGYPLVAVLGTRPSVGVGHVTSIVGVRGDTLRAFLEAQRVDLLVSDNATRQRAGPTKQSRFTEEQMVAILRDADDSSVTTGSQTLPGRTLPATGAP